MFLKVIDQIILFAASKNTKLKIQSSFLLHIVTYFIVEIKYNFGFSALNCFFLAHLLTLCMSSWRNILMKVQTAMRAMTITSRVPTLVLLVVEVMAVLSRPVCSLSTDDREVRSPDNTAVFTFSNPSGLCTDPIKLVMVELSSFKPSRMVVSTAFGSPPSSPERPRREVMLFLCWSNKAPAFCRTLPTLPALPGSGSDSGSGSGWPPSPCGR